MKRLTGTIAEVTSSRLTVLGISTIKLQFHSPRTEYLTWQYRIEDNLNRPHLNKGQVDRALAARQVVAIAKAVVAVTVTFTGHLSQSLIMELKDFVGACFCDRLHNRVKSINREEIELSLITCKYKWFNPTI